MGINNVVKQKKIISAKRSIKTHYGLISLMSLATHSSTFIGMFPALLAVKVGITIYVLY